MREIDSILIKTTTGATTAVATAATIDALNQWNRPFLRSSPPHSHLSLDFTQTQLKRMSMFLYILLIHTYIYYKNKSYLFNFYVVYVHLCSSFSLEGNLKIKTNEEEEGKNSGPNEWMVFARRPAPYFCLALLSFYSASASIYQKKKHFKTDSVHSFVLSLAGFSESRRFNELNLFTVAIFDTWTRWTIKLLDAIHIYANFYVAVVVRLVCLFAWAKIAVCRIVPYRFLWFLRSSV